jgi:hypothetical protein
MIEQLREITGEQLRRELPGTAFRAPVTTAVVRQDLRVVLHRTGHRVPDAAIQRE